MSRQAEQLAELAARLREEFDRSFAEAPGQNGADYEDFLGISLGQDRFALCLTDVCGLVTGKKVIPLPGPLAEFIGIVGLRGQIMPVYDLARLLGHLEGIRSLKWLILVGRAIPLALSVGSFDSYLRVRKDAISGHEDKGKATSEVIRTADAVRAIIRMQVVMDTISNRAKKALG